MKLKIKGPKDENSVDEPTMIYGRNYQRPKKSGSGRKVKRVRIQGRFMSRKKTDTDLDLDAVEDETKENGEEEGEESEEGEEAENEEAAPDSEAMEVDITEGEASPSLVGIHLISIIHPSFLQRSKSCMRR